MKVCSDCLICGKKLKHKLDTIFLFCPKQDYDELFNLLEYKQIHNEKIYIKTDGRLFSNLKFSELISKYVSKIKLYSYGLNGENINMFTGNVDSLNLFIRGLKNLRDYGIFFETIVIDYKLDEPKYFNNPLEVILEVTSSCNFNCKGCFNKNNFAISERDKKYLDISYVKEIIDSISNYGIKEIRFSGGEPLSHPDIFEMLRYAKEKQLFVTLNTNGSMITKENVKFIGENTDDVLISFYGYDDETDSKWTGIQDSFSRKIFAINLLINESAKIRCGIILTNESILNIDKIYLFLKNMGVYDFSFFRALSKDILNFDSKNLFNTLLKIMFNSGRLFRIGNTLPFCTYDAKKMNLICLGGIFDDGHSRIIVDPRGFAKPDYSSNINLGDPRDIMSCWNHPHMKKIRNLEYLPKECYDCIYKEKCKGGSRELSYQKYNRFDAHDPLANLNNKVLIDTFKE